MKKKYIPFTYLPTDFTAAGDFLDRKAQAGWAFTKSGVFYGVFTPTGRTDLRYHAEPAYGKADPARQALYRDAGWEYVARAWLLDVYASAPGGEARPIHSDQGVELDALGRVFRRMLLCLLPALLITALMCAFWLAPWSDEEFRLLTYRTFFSNYQLVMTLFLLVSTFLFAATLYTLVHFFRCRRVLARSGALPAPAPGPARARSFLLSGGLFLFIFFYLAFLSMSLTGISLVQRLDDAAPLPMVRVADLFPGQEEGAYLDVERRASLFAESYYYVNYLNGGYVLSHYYDCGVLPIEGVVAFALLREERQPEPPMGHIHGPLDMATADLGFEEAWVGRDPAEGVFCLILRQGDTVARVEATADLTDPAVLTIIRQRFGWEALS